MRYSHMEHYKYTKQHQNHNPNTLNFAQVLHNIEVQVNEHSVHGMFFAFIAGILGNIQHTPSPSAFEQVVKMAANISILLGCLIAVITLAVKIKELHTTFFKGGKVARRRKPTEKEPV